jgi:hypothetical protein
MHIGRVHLPVSHAVRSTMLWSTMGRQWSTMLECVGREWRRAAPGPLLTRNAVPSDATCHILILATGTLPTYSRTLAAHTDTLTTHDTHTTVLPRTFIAHARTHTTTHNHTRGAKTGGAPPAAARPAQSAPVPPPHCAVEKRGPRACSAAWARLGRAHCVAPSLQLLAPVPSAWGQRWCGRGPATMCGGGLCLRATTTTFPETCDAVVGVRFPGNVARWRGPAPPSAAARVPAGQRAPLRPSAGAAPRD